MKTQHIKWLGLIGALFAGASSLMSGDITTGVGVIGAALSSASALSTRQ